MMDTKLVRIARAGLAAVLVAAPGLVAAQSSALDASRLESWLEGYEQAWEGRDAEAAAGLFTSDARYYETPYAEPFSGREGIAAYWSDVTAGQREIDFEAEVVAIEGSTGVARWRAEFVAGPDATPVGLAGVFVLEFAADGLCSELREWWHMRPQE